MIDPKKCIHHKGYFGSVNYCAEDDLLYGKVLGIRGHFMYHGYSLSEVKEAFQEAVEDYIEYCQEENTEDCKGQHDAVMV